MCGIAGIISCTQKYTAQHLQQMTDALAHRGPDGEGFWMDENEGIYLGHRRLSIIDLSEKGKQPMHFLERFVIIHNGEIYNYKELKLVLESKGYQFQSQTDTEVIVAAYDHWGADCLQQFEGMFAFAIWDRTEKTLFLARDRMGEKPLYYYTDSNTGAFLFASELKAFWSIDLPRQISEDMMIAYLGLGISVHPNNGSRTFYKGYAQLKPGHYVILKGSESTIDQQVSYWNCPSTYGSDYTDNEAIDLFQQLFRQSISNRLRSDVQIGSSLSGGLDSSSVVAMIKEQSANHSNYSYHSFTAVFPGFEKNEQEGADRVVKQFGLTQHLVSPNQNDFASFLPNLIKIHEEPISSASVYAQYCVFAEAKKQGIKVLLDGQGADELLGGYSKYRVWWLQELLAGGKISAYRTEKKAFGRQAEPLNWGVKNYMAAIFPEWASKKLSEVTYNKIVNSTYLSPEFIQAYLSPEIVEKPVIRNLNDLLHHNSFTAGLNELLRYADRNSMANSCEVRLPFLYHPLIEFIFGLPSRFKLRDGYTKWLLRKSMEALLPKEIVFNKEKIGFEPPQFLWMQHKQVIEQIEAGKENLIRAGVLSKSVRAKKNQPHSSYAAEGKDWRYLSAGLLL